MLSKIFYILALAVFTAYGAAENYVIDQTNKKFSKDKITVKVGDTIDFLNADPFFHNVFSLSDTQMFDLGSYPKGESKRVTFEKPGKVDVECAIHPDMLMTVTVEE